MAFCEALPSLGETFEAHPRCSTCQASLSLYGQIPRTARIRHVSFIRSPARGHSGCFGRGAVVADAVVRVRVRDLVGTCLPRSRAQPRGGLPGTPLLQELQTCPRRLRHVNGPTGKGPNFCPSAPALTDDSDAGGCGAVSRCVPRLHPVRVKPKMPITQGAAERHPLGSSPEGSLEGLSQEGECPRSQLRDSTCWPRAWLRWGQESSTPAGWPPQGRELRVPQPGPGEEDPVHWSPSPALGMCNSERRGTLGPLHSWLLGTVDGAGTSTP